MPNFKNNHEQSPQRQQPRAGGSFAARFGRIILQNGIATVPSALFHYQGALQLSAQQVWLVSYILAHKWDEDLPYPSLKAMSKRVGMSLSQLQRIKNTLCEMGHLKVYPRFTEKQGQATNAYDFSGLFDRLEEMITADAPLANGIRAESDNPPDMAELGQVDPSFVARYGRVITRRGVAAVPRAMFTHQAALGMTAQQVWFVTYIFSFQWDTALPYPSIRKMANITGYSSVQLHTIKAELVASAYLRLVHRSNDQGGQDTNAYDFSGLLDKIRELLGPGPTTDDGRRTNNNTDSEQDNRPIVRRRGRKAQISAVNGGSIELSRGSSAKLRGGDSAELIEGGSRELTGRSRKRLSGRGSAELVERDSAGLPEAGNATHAGGTSVPYSRGIARGLHEIESGKIETNNKKDDSNQHSQRNESTRNANGAAPQPYSPYVASVISDFSDELSDSSHVISNVTQALRLWESSAMDEQAFTELLYEAKRITRTYQGKQGLNGMSNKMAYFFKVARDLCNNQQG